MWVDSHCHLDLPELAGCLPEVLVSMQEKNVVAALTIAVNLEDFPQVLALAEHSERLYASVGVHPEYADAKEATEDELCRLAQHPKILGIGETGLDYYWHKDQPEWQRQRFRTHIRAARRVGKPLIVHTREAREDTLRILAEEGAAEVGGVLHCFTEDWAMAERALDLNFHISFSGIVTFRNAEALREVARQVPADRLLVETDSPYLAPIPHRGKPNLPEYVRDVAEYLATLRGVSYETLAQQTTENFQRLFPLARVSS